MKGCLFCKFASHEIGNDDIFYEDDTAFAMLDIDWAVKGHSMVISKKHVLNMSDLSRDDFLHFSDVCRQIEEKLLKAVNKDKSVILKTGNLQPHFHFHIYPIDSDMSWEAIREMMEKKFRYELKEGEREELLALLK